VKRVALRYRGPDSGEMLKRAGSLLFMIIGFALAVFISQQTEIIAARQKVFQYGSGAPEAEEA